MSHSTSTTNDTIKTPKNQVKNFICFWWADGVLFSAM